VAKLVSKELLADRVGQFEIDAPLIARKAQPGQFVVLRTLEQGERFPITISDADPAKGTIKIIVQDAGLSTHTLFHLQAGDDVLDVVGPLGKPTHVDKFGTVVCIGGGVGIAILRPEVQAFKEAGNKVITIIGARTKDLVILEKELGKWSDKVLVTTDDGSYGRHGFVSDELTALIESGERIDLVVAIGPLIMMKVIADITRPHKINTIVSLNPIMVDATGMCGACRVTVGGKTMFACVDGPEFDGHEVDFDELGKRLRMYSGEERSSMEQHEKAEAGQVG
jgi:ferredoxin--NADP+ reductase